MSLKILVADDSLTIQKVVGITLANSDYELVQALTEQELFQKINSDQFALVLLDFNLSDDKDGYQLAKELKKAQPSTPIMVMLGTFDSVDDNQLKESGISDKVVKPFESHKFIQLCENLIESGPEEEFEISSSDVTETELEAPSVEATEEEVEEFNPGDDWVLESPDVEEKVEEETELMPEENFIEAESDVNQLQAEVEGWGMSVPGVIGGGEVAESSMPPVMTEDSPIEQEQEEIVLGGGSIDDIEEAEEVSAMPSDDDLAMPSDDDLAFPDLSTSMTENTEEKEPSSQLVSIDDLAPNDDDGEEDLDATNPQMPAPEIEKNLELEQELSDDLSPDDFWAADEEDTSGDEDETSLQEAGTGEIDLESITGEEVDQAVESISMATEGESQIEHEIVLEEEPHSTPVYEEEVQTQNLVETSAPAAVAIDEDLIVAKVKEAMEPMLEELVKRFAQESLEKVAWDIMPDLAENLIREEIQKISTSSQE